jgi:thermitase
MRRRLAVCAVRVCVAGAVGLLAAMPAAGAPAVGGKTEAPNAAAWSLQRVGLPQAWRFGRGDPSTVVAVLDSGVDASDPDLVGALVPGHDFVDGGTDTADDLGHGTLAAGVVAGRGAAGASPGACPRCRIMPVRVIDAAGEASAAAIASGIVWAVDNGARVVNMSFVMPTTDPGIAAAVRYAVDRGVVLVAGAGNSGGSTIQYPAGYPGVVSVAATGPADGLEPWSTRGGWVSTAAPGCSVSVGVNGRPASFCGTSSSTALVSGIVALAISAAHEPSGAAVVSALASTSVPIGPGVVWGRVDAAALVGSLVPRPTPAHA